MAIGHQSFYQTALTSSINDTDLIIPLDTVPTVSEGFLVIESTVEAKREIIYFTSKDATTVTCPSGAGNGRGYDGTTAVSHTQGAAVIMAPVGVMFEKFGTVSLGGINDTNGNELLKVTATASAVNELTLANAATGNNPTITPTGGDTNISVRMQGKGTGGVWIDQYQPYKFDVTNSANQGSIGTAATQITFDTEVFDTNSNFATNQYTAPVAGFYWFYATAQLAAQVSATSATMWIYKNGAAFARIAYMEATNVGYGLQGGCQMSLAASDTVRLYISTTGTGTNTISTGTSLTRFGGRLVSMT